ncbi:MAG: helix-turn-helix domain-containing protein [Candidatus Dormibacteria bacterium]
MYKRHGAWLTNRLPELMRERGLSEAEVAARAARALGQRLDPRTLHRYLSGGRLEAPALTALAAVCDAVGVSIGDAVQLEREDSIDELLRRCGIRVLQTPQPGALGRLGKLSSPPPAWGDTTDAWLADRHRPIG